MNKFTAVVGVAFGDESKGNVTYQFSKDYAFVVKAGGSGSAGHTIYHGDKKIIRSYIPCADFSNSHVVGLLGSDMLINPEVLLKEILENKKVIPNIGSKLILDPNAFIVTKEHIEQDQLNKTTVGSVGTGSTPAAISKVSRTGIKFANLIKDNAEIIRALETEGVQFKYTYELFEQFKRSNILFECSQSVLLDITGVYPMTTSIATHINSIVNAGFAKFLPQKIYGITKCYTTRVGLGNLPTELYGGEAEELRTKGKEFGSVSGRPRRIGWLDLPMTKYSCDIAGVTDLIVTKFDILDNYQNIKVCTGYDRPLRCADDINTAIPQYTKVPSWSNSRDISQIRPFINLVESNVGIKVSYISCGVNPDDMIKL